jgi:hypothetical protein
VVEAEELVGLEVEEVLDSRPLVDHFVTILLVAVDADVTVLEGCRDLQEEAWQFALVLDHAGLSTGAAVVDSVCELGENACSGPEGVVQVQSHSAMDVGEPGVKLAEARAVMEVLNQGVWTEHVAILHEVSAAVEAVLTRLCCQLGMRSLKAEVVWVVGFGHVAGIGDFVVVVVVLVAPDGR